ncbi:MAG TPA: hypothetical protein VL285_20455 [Bryobacteraceae bacterium]|nr:hypothetical protein [Bryobacteraceae bacterium]
MSRPGSVAGADRLAASYGFYDELARLTPSPVVDLNRAVAVAMAYGPQAGLERIDELMAEGALEGYHLLPSVRGDLLARLGRRDEARVEFERAASMTQNARERRLLEERARNSAPSPNPDLPLESSVSPG